MFVMCVSCVFGACSQDPSSHSEDMDVVIDMPEDQASDLTQPLDMPDAEPDLEAPVDMPEEEDLAAQDMPADLIDMAPDMPSPDMPDGGLPGVCEGDCATQELTVTFGAETRSLGRAIYGLTAPSEEGEPWTLYLEALEGELDKCPEGPSAPDYTMIFANIPIFEDDMAITKEMVPGLSVAFFDFQGDLLPDNKPFTRADSITVSARALSVCEACVGMPAPSDEDGFLALTMEATFEEGTIAGDIYAVHCDSMDQPPIVEP